jgi:rhodanese-related sulfurtransferase
MFVHKKTITFCLLIGSLLFASIVAADEVISPEFVAGTVKVTAEELIGLVAEKPDLVIVDSRIRGDRQNGYIETSVSLPDNETSCKTLATIIPTKVTPALFYCNGIKCGRSAVAAKIARECGYVVLYWYREGYEDWLKKSYPYVQD